MLAALSASTLLSEFAQHRDVREQYVKHDACKESSEDCSLNLAHEHSPNRNARAKAENQRRELNAHLSAGFSKTDSIVGMRSGEISNPASQRPDNSDGHRCRRNPFPCCHAESSSGSVIA